ncbi:hypothetical protein Tco_1177459, partial [Tanacetum coccineum]
RTIDQAAGGKLRDKNAKESWALLEDLALYDNESWNDPRDFTKPVKAISLPQDVPSTSDRARHPYYAKKDFTDYHLPSKWEIARDAEHNPLKDVLIFKRKVEFLGVIPIYLKRNMWESKGLIENRIDWNKPPKGGDGARHAKIRLIDPNGEEFTKNFQSIPTARKLS